MRQWGMVLAVLLCTGILLAPKWMAQEVVAAEEAITMEPKEVIAVEHKEMASFDDALELKVLREDTVVEMSLGEYLVGVVSREMSETFPAEALKAQAVAARTFTLRQIENGKHRQADICTDSSCCQAWTAEHNEQARQAVVETDGLVAVYDDRLIEATYFSCSGGRTEPAVAVWGNDLPYLQSVSSPGEEDAPRFTETVELEAELFAQRLLSAYPQMELCGTAPQWFGQLRYTVGGGLAEVELGGVSVTGISLRKLFGLRSTDMRFAVNEERIQITTYGYGHRVGMSQYGAKAMAEAGAGFEEILTYYYQGVELRRLELVQE